VGYTENWQVYQLCNRRGGGQRGAWGGERSEGVLPAINCPLSVGNSVAGTVCVHRAAPNGRWPRGPIRWPLADLVCGASTICEPEAKLAHVLNWMSMWHVQLSARSWSCAPEKALC
jgi:hypothetical protein